MNWKRKRVFITGASGFLGSWLTQDLIEKGAYVVALIRDGNPQSMLVRSGLIKEIAVVQGTLEDFLTVERAVAEYQVDTVFHLGAQAIVGVAQVLPLQTFESNIRGSYHLLEACKRHEVERVVVASSDKAYGESVVLPYTEDMPLRGRYPYDVSKSCTDLLAQAYYHTYGLPVGIARCGNIYGGGDLNFSRLIPGSILSLYENQRPVVRSDGLYTRDYIYVKDVVLAYLLLAEGLGERGGQAFNFAPERPYTVLEVLTEIKRLMAKEIEPVILNKAKGEIIQQNLDATKAREFLGWKPLYSLEKGLEETIQWYQEFLGGMR